MTRDTLHAEASQQTKLLVSYVTRCGQAPVIERMLIVQKFPVLQEGTTLSFHNVVSWPGHMFVDGLEPRSYHGRKNSTNQISTPKPREAQSTKLQYLNRGR